MRSDLFCAPVQRWFESTFPRPSPVQERAWPAIREKHHTLLAAPTGSGKTLAAFLAVIDELARQKLQGTLPDTTRVVYVSPLKALSNDIHKNLQIPRAGIHHAAQELDLGPIDLSVMVRTGDTPAWERAAMTRKPPHILVTTPESLYLLLTSKNGRLMLAETRTLIVDEIHALLGNKRGAHLALSMERLDRLTGYKLTRIGLSATQKPMDTVARYLVGGLPEAPPPCVIIDEGHSRTLDLDIEIPRSPLSAVMSNETWEEIFSRLEQLILEHKTTLIFVSTRSLSERVAHHLTDRLGPEIVTAHHGSMARDQRLAAEQQLKSGALRALVATASLELGIDIGSVDLVCQIGSPRTIATFLQRVGRSGHTIDGTPRGRLFPLSRDDLVEAAALLYAIRKRDLDHIHIPGKPLDVLAQQIVAEVACENYDENILFEALRKARPYNDLNRNEFYQVITMLTDGFTPRQGRRRALLSRDAINQTLSARKGARLTAITSGGVIPDQFDYDVIQEPTGAFVGTLNEDFAIESAAGDIVQLGNTSWRILRVERGKVRVEDAHGLPPTMPFWFGEAPSRSRELSEAVSVIRKTVADAIDINTLREDTDPIPDNHWMNLAIDRLVSLTGVSTEVATQITLYIGMTRVSLGAVPTTDTIVAERFFDDAGDMSLVIHAPFGSRINRAWGLALRKRFCRTFNFELQAAANENSIILSLGATHSFELEEVFRYLHPASVRHVLTQALLDAPMFGARWRWNASNALAIPRRRGGERTPPQIQRSQAEDLVALVFPDQIACLENIAGDREIPDHPLVNQTITDCLHEAMDIDALETLLTDIHNGHITTLARDVVEPSPMAQEILNARPYAFLDDAPLEERRTNAVRNRRWLDPAEISDLSLLDENAIAEVKKEAWPQVTSPEELKDTLLLSGFITEQEGRHGDGLQPWTPSFDTLLTARQATRLSVNATTLWIATERLFQFLEVFPDATTDPQLRIPETLEQRLRTLRPSDDRASALTDILRGRLEILGPVTAHSLVTDIGLPHHDIEHTLIRLQNEGFVFKGRYTPGCSDIEWCERRLLARIHRYTMSTLRREIQPVPVADFMRFLFDWHHLTDNHHMQGPDGLQEVLSLLEGVEAPAIAWESDILPARVKDYDYLWLDVLCMSGVILWGRFRIPSTTRNPAPVKTTPITLMNRENLPMWRSLADEPPTDTPLSPNATLIYTRLQQDGALFFHDLVARTRLLTSQTEEALAELVSTGKVTADSFTGLRALLVPDRFRENNRRNRKPVFSMNQAGRWALINPPEPLENTAEATEHMARTLLRRYGVVCRRLAEREPMTGPWRDMVRIYRRLEMRGEIRGGRFIDGVGGEQFALPEAIGKLRNTRNTERNGQLIAISAADPLNLVGVLTPGNRVPILPSNRILFRDGTPIMILEAGEVKTLTSHETESPWSLKNALIQRKVAPQLKAYLGRGIG
jgi:ATP-dependent Lhr-like helicase